MTEQEAIEFGASVATKLVMQKAGMENWRSVEDMPDWDYRPSVQFIVLEGEREHSGVRWRRTTWGVAHIRAPGADDEMLGYRESDIVRICEDGDMELMSARVTHWLPAIVPHLPR